MVGLRSKSVRDELWASMFALRRRCYTVDEIEGKILIVDACQSAGSILGLLVTVQRRRPADRSAQQIRSAVVTASQHP